MSRILFHQKVCNLKEYEPELYYIHCFVPKMTALYLKGENIGIKGRLVRLYFWLITRGRLRIYYCTDFVGEVIHTSCVMPKCFKFPFMEKDSIIIGPCSTKPQFRGQGIYPAVLQFVLREKSLGASNVYMVVDHMNTSSIRGVEKAGFVPCGRIRVGRVMKRYYKEEELDGNYGLEIL